MELLFGDIHNHCGMTYGYGSLEHALAAAREQLDFCMVTGHADVAPIFRSAHRSARFWWTITKRDLPN